MVTEGLPARRQDDGLVHRPLSARRGGQERLARVAVAGGAGRLAAGEGGEVIRHFTLRGTQLWLGGNSLTRYEFQPLLGNQQAKQNNNCSYGFLPT